jgi:hypothetical protein
MPRKSIELPPSVARAFVRDMRLFFKEKNAIKRDGIAARQLHALRPYNSPRGKKLRLSDVHEMFLQNERSWVSRLRATFRVQALRQVRMSAGF